MSQQCSCGYKNRNDASFCGKCGKQVSRKTSSQSILPQSIEGEIVSFGLDDPTSLRRFRAQAYAQMAALGQESQLWDWFGKHKAYYKAHKLTQEVLDERLNLTAQNLIAQHQLVLETAIILAQLQIEDMVVTERLNRDLVRLRKALVQLAETFDDETLKHIHPDIKDEFIEALTNALLHRTVGDEPRSDPSQIY